MTMVRLRRHDPRTVGSYRLLRRLGAGGMGVVYLGTDRHGRKVALKLIRPELANNPEFRSRFAREVSAASRVRGSRTAPLVDADPHAPRPWLATAYVPGPSLQRRVGERGPLGCLELARVGAAVADGLVSVHEAGVVHRDVKPSNILLSPDGPQIIDFGIAWADGAGTLTHTGTAVGSPGFLAPEQVRGASVSPATDVFALGVTLAYAGRGATPFGSGPVDALLYRVVHEEPDLDGVPEAVVPIIAACLAKDPRVRPKAAEVRDRLNALVRRRSDDGPDPRGASAEAAERAGLLRPDGRGDRLRGETPSGRRVVTDHQSLAGRNGGDRTARSERGERTEPRLDRAAERTDRADRTDRTDRAERADRAERPGRPPARPVRRRTPRPAERRPEQRRRLLVAQLVVFVIVTAIAALAITALQDGDGDDGDRGTPPVVEPGGSAHGTPAFGPAQAPPPGADWGERTYADPTAGGSSLTLTGGRAMAGTDTVVLSEVLPASFHGEPAAVVLLTRTPGGGGPPVALVELFRFDGGVPAPLGVYAAQADPRAAATRWGVVAGAVERTEVLGGGGEVVTRVRVRDDGVPQGG